MTYKTHEQLGITAEERAAAILTIDVLRAEQIVFDMGEPCDPNVWEGERDQPGETTTCGTNCCIGGAMSLIMQNGGTLPGEVTSEMVEVAHNYVILVGSADGAASPALDHLFYDVTDSRALPRDGIAAIERFLRGDVMNPWQDYEPEDDSDDEE